MGAEPPRIDVAPSLLDESAEDLYEHAPCGYVSALPDGTIVRVNQRVLTWIGQSRDAIIGLRLQQLFTVGGRIYLETHVMPLLQMQGFVREIALDLRREGEGRLSVLLNAEVRRNENDQVVGVRAMLFDVTDRRRYERELLATRREAEEAARVRAELVAMISHDIRTPLAAIMTVAELLQATEMSPAQSKYVRLLQSSSGNLLHLVNDVLDLGKLETGKMKLEEKPLDLRLLIERLVDELRVKTDEKNLALVTEIGPEVPRAVIGDSIKIGRIITNLLGNAIKFTQHGTVSISVQAPQRDADGVTLALSVSDTGIGIPPSQLTRIFEDFTQANDEIASTYGGSGLGLGICKKLLGLHGSQLKVVSREGVGSTFSFDLRLKVAPSTATSSSLAH